MQYDLTPWMKSWGWQLNPQGQWEKHSDSGLIIAFQCDATWQADYNRACEYESQLMGSRAN